MTQDKLSLKALMSKAAKSRMAFDKINSESPSVIDQDEKNKQVKTLKNSQPELDTTLPLTDPKKNHKNSTHQVDTASRHSKEIQQYDPEERYIETIYRDDQLSRCVDTEERYAETTSRHDKSKDQADTEKQHIKTIQINDIDTHQKNDNYNVIMGEKKLLKTQQQRELYNYLIHCGNHITKKPHIAENTGIPLNSVIRIMRILKERGLINYEPIKLDGHGLCTKISITKDITNTKSRYSKSTQLTDISIRSVESPSMIDRSDNNIYLSKEEKILALTDDDIAFDWPKLKATGFGQHQIKQIVDKLKKKDKSTDNLISSFDHIEFELEKGDLVDKEGNKIANPCGYIFNALARHGYYRKPAGYISPEEQAAREAAEELKAKKEALKKAQELKFEVWKMELTDEKKAELRQKQPGGNDLNDRYLKSCFLKEVQQAEG